MTWTDDVLEGIAGLLEHELDMAYAMLDHERLHGVPCGPVRSMVDPSRMMGIRGPVRGPVHVPVFVGR